MKDLMFHKANLIFLADDDDDDAYFVKTAIHELDPKLHVTHFLNGRQLLNGLALSVENPPSFVLLDLNMPVLDGRETLRLIRKTYGNAFPVIIFSTSNHQHEKDLCFEYGATAYYTKPCSYPLYLEILQKIKMDLEEHAVTEHVTADIKPPA